MDRNASHSSQQNDRSEDSRQAESLHDWRAFDFVSIDSQQTALVQDAIHVSPRSDVGPVDSWHLDLRVIHPLPLGGIPSLTQGIPKVCLGFYDELQADTFGTPSISLVIAANAHRLIDSQAASLGVSSSPHSELSKHEESVQKSSPDSLPSKLRLLRTAALRVSPWTDRDLRPEHSVDLILTHTQRRMLRATRNLAACPALIVLRPISSRFMTAKESRKLGGMSKLPIFETTSGSRIPTLVRGSEAVQHLDTLRLKQHSMSGAINMVQISCALLGIAPIPADIISEAIPSTSEKDRGMGSAHLPEPLQKAMNERRDEIHRLLTKCVPELL